MGRRKQLENNKRNNIFAAAIDEIRRREGKVTQLDIAARMGVSKDTVTNILHSRTIVTDEMITKLQTASGCIFNLQWLRGESDVMLAENASKNVAKQNEETWQSVPDYSSMVNSIIAAKDEAISALKDKIKAKDETIAALKEQLAAKNSLIEVLEGKVMELPHTFGVAEPTGKYNRK